MTTPRTFKTLSLALAERHLGKSIAEIVEEARSASGLSLTTLTALSAALSFHTPVVGLPLDVFEFQFDQAVTRASADIDKRGTAAVGAEVGAALGAYIESVLAERT